MINGEATDQNRTIPEARETRGQGSASVAVFAFKHAPGLEWAGVLCLLRNSQQLCVCPHLLGQKQRHQWILKFKLERCP